MLVLRTAACLMLALLCTASSWAAAQSGDLLSRLGTISDEELANPPAADWLNWRRTYDAHGFSPLDQINRGNVAQLQQVWRTELQQGPNMATPLVHDGVMFLASTQDRVLALDASSGEQLWSYEHRPTAFPSSKIGIALHGDKVIVPTQNMHVIALNARSGELIWDHAITTTATGPLPYALRGAPLVANGMVLQGVTATLIPEGGFIVGLNLETGNEVWRFHTVARPDEAGGETWNGLSLAERSGGSVWVPASYDPQLDLVYYGTAPTYDTGPLLHRSDDPDVSNEALY
ncbi:MAG: PQQ-binding-like beta-propeller repeat protein, partial [Gammaproteobacteria bacterium]